MNVTAGALKTRWGEAAKMPDPVKGEKFDRYVRDVLFPQELYELRYDYEDTRDDYISHSKLPDHKYRSINEGIEFFVETRCRARFQDRILEWCKFFELKHYQEIDNIIPVLIAIGLGGKPSAPERAFLVPVKHIKFVKLYPLLLQKYEIDPGRHISERFLKILLQ